MNRPARLSRPRLRSMGLFPGTLLVLVVAALALLAAAGPAPFHGAAGSLLLLAVVALLLALVVALVAGRSTARRVRLLTLAARRMAGGELGLRTRPSGTDDLAELGRALDTLAANLARTLGDLTAERDLLRGILGGMQEGVLLLDPEGRIVKVNPALRRMLLLGPLPEGCSLLEGVRHAGLKDLLDRARAGREQEPVAGEVEVGGLNPRRLLVRAALLPGIPSGPGSILAVFVDVTDLRRLEAVRRDFVANVSHELRTPVTAILSGVETLRQAFRADPAAAVRFLDLVERNARRLARLVDDLLDLSRIESRELRLNLQSVPLDPVVTQVLCLFREAADRKGIRLAVAGCPAEARALGDRRAIEQVLCNLVDNAIKYCPEGALVTVRVTPGASTVGVAVEDTGPGIEARHLPRIFERFYRVDAGRSRDLGGTGLGLAIVKHLVEAMGGGVAVTSTVGKGSVFRVTLPAA